MQNLVSILLSIALVVRFVMFQLNRRFVVYRIIIFFLHIYSNKTTKKTQTKSQWDWEASAWQNEYVHNRIIGDGAHVPCNVTKVRQIDGAANGRTTSENNSRSGAFVHWRPLQADILVGPGVQNAYFADSRWFSVRGRLRSRSYSVCVWVSVTIIEIFAGTRIYRLFKLTNKSIE